MARLMYAFKLFLLMVDSTYAYLSTPYLSASSLLNTLTAYRSFRGFMSAYMSQNTIDAAQTPVSYNDKVIRQFAIMTVVWGVVGMLVGVWIAAELLWPSLNFDLPFLTFSRLRPLHTNAVIFAFGGCGLFAASYYVVQRTSHVRLFGGKLA